MRYENLHFTLNFILNGFLHVTFLFSFLTILYHFIISPLTESTLRDLIGSSIDTIYDSSFPDVTISLSQLIGANLNDTARLSSIIKDSIKLSSNSKEKFDISNIDQLLKVLSKNESLFSDKAMNLYKEILSNGSTSLELLLKKYQIPLESLFEFIEI